MKVLGIFCSAPYADAPRVRLVHSQLRAAGLLPTSRWAEQATGAENLASLSRHERRAIVEENDRGVDAADAMIVLPAPLAGRELYCEIGRARARELPVYVVGFEGWLSAACCVSVPTVAAAIDAILAGGRS